MSGYRIARDDFDGPEIRALLDHHLREAHRNSPPGSVYALDLSGLRTADVTVWTAWDGATLLGCGALKALAADTGEVKSMRTDPRHLRRGVAAALLGHIIGVARARGYRRLSLETGSGTAYAAAEALYRRYGLVFGPPFGGYAATEFNRFMHLDL